MADLLYASATSCSNWRSWTSHWALSLLEDSKELAKLDADFITDDHALCDPGASCPTQEMRWNTERNLGSDILGFVRL
jgi:hypothetical protein